MLIIFGLSLMMSPMAIRIMTETQAQTQVEVPQRVITQAEAKAACDAQALETAIGRVGCTKTVDTGQVRRID